MGVIARILSTLDTLKRNLLIKEVKVEEKVLYNSIAELYNNFGLDANPLVDDRILLIPVGGSGKLVAIGTITINPQTNPGEVRIFSRDSSGNEQAEIFLKNNKSIELNGNSKRFVTHAELDTALQTHITALNVHTHSGVTTGPGTSGPPVNPLSLDISAAETQTIKTGG